MVPRAEDRPWSARPFISSESGTPVLPPVESSITIECKPGRSARSVWSNRSVGPTLPIAAVLKPCAARHLQYCFFIQIVAAEVLIDIAQYRIVLDEGTDVSPAGADG